MINISHNASTELQFNPNTNPNDYTEFIYYYKLHLKVPSRSLPPSLPPTRRPLNLYRQLLEPRNFLAQQRVNALDDAIRARIYGGAPVAVRAPDIVRRGGHRELDVDRADER